MNSLGRPFLDLEDFYRDGLAAGPDPEVPGQDDYMDAHEWDEMMFRRAIEKDRD